MSTQNNESDTEGTQSSDVKYSFVDPEDPDKSQGSKFDSHCTDN